MVLGRLLPGVGDDLLGGGGGLLRLLLQDAGGSGPRLLDRVRSLRVGLSDHLAALLLRPGQLDLDPLGVGQPFRDLPPPLLEHGEDAAIGEPVEEGADDSEADDLGDQMRPIHPERPCDPFDLPARIGLRQKKESIHRRTFER